MIPAIAFLHSGVVTVMLLLSFWSDRRFWRFFLKQTSELDLGLQPCLFLFFNSFSPTVLACHNVSRFDASFLVPLLCYRIFY